MAFVVFAQTAIVVHPAKAAFDDPAFGQYLEACHSITAFDNFNSKPKTFLDLVLPLFSLEAAVSPHYFQRSAHLSPSQMPKSFLGALTLGHTRRKNDDFQPQPECVANDEAFASGQPFGAVIASLEEAGEPPLEVVFTLWLSTMAALG